MLARRLKNANFDVRVIGYPSWSWPLDRIADHVHLQLAGDERRLHFVGHSMGGLILRAYLTRYKPARLGRAVMLGTPNSGSELADLVHDLGLHGPILNRAGPCLRTRRPTSVDTCLGTVDYPLGVIAGDRSPNPLANIIFHAPNDGMVSVAATHVPGQTDHLVMPVQHATLIYSRPVANQIIHFLRTGEFER